MEKMTRIMTRIADRIITRVLDRIMVRIIARTTTRIITVMEQITALQQQSKLVIQLP